MLHILIFTIGFLAGVTLMSYIVRRINDGLLYLNMTDPESAVAGVEFFKGATDIAKRKRVVLIVHTQK